MKIKHIKTYVVRKAFLIIILCFIFINANPQKTNTLMSLKGKWWFMIVNKSEDSIPDPHSDMWEVINVPGNWESQGYNGYNGYAWYKKVITIPESYKDKSLGLELGYIDDVDEVYLNGHLIGFSGSFPPRFTSAYNARRVYNLPKEYLKFNEKNVIAIRIFDTYGEGGIVNGNVRIFEYTNTFPLDIDLQGIWKFKIGDNSNWKEENMDETNWKNMYIPTNWENQGYKDIDGYAWCRKTFTLPKELADKDLLLIAGKIDDLDQTYFNGTLIGNTGKFYNDKRLMTRPEDVGPEWTQYRIYEIPNNIIKAGVKNTISIRIFDIVGMGGIYQGPVGIISKETYFNYRNDKKLN
ncbi:MAG: hypothetical protein JXB49_01145 [Bacteroidales bacterium]|nr:hypothetical protein [Bacteroidales bacterium]